MLLVHISINDYSLSDYSFWEEQILENQFVDEDAPLGYRDYYKTDPSKFALEEKAIDDHFSK